MKEKIRVWNQEVSCCNECNYCYLDSHDYYMCGYTTEEIEDGNIIDLNCPFKQPITKDVIESFEFKNTNKTAINNALIFEKGKYTLWANFDKNKFRIRTQSMFDPEFYGTINNPEELKFILKSLNIV